ncbi:MAG TPA: acyl-CoA dehydrogenase family protein [Acidimicrobiales bacterium]|nr:acyl-CoA dehydrogenase family protein [Acidimicrobiales bacterium]
MDFELSDDQRALQDAASTLLDDRCLMTRVREVADGTGQLDDLLWSAMAEQGWLAVELPEAAGGLGLGLVETVVLCEQLGRHLAPAPFLGTVLTGVALASAVADGAIDPTTPLGEVAVGTWIEQLAAGDAVGAVAWSRRPEAVTARPDVDGGWTLSGRTDLVVYGPSADVVVVFAEAEGSPALFALAPLGPERPTAEPAMDRTRSVGWLALADRRALRLGGADRAGDLLDRAATASSAEMLGAADRVLEMTVAYAKDRVQFGRPIGGFQAVKHRCADMLVDVEGMRSATYYAAWAVGAADPDARAAASVAKVWCSDAARRVMASGLQVHGGIGFTWEHDLHLFLKRSQLDQMGFGDAGLHRERLAQILRPRAASGLSVL